MFTFLSRLTAKKRLGPHTGPNGRFIEIPENRRVHKGTGNWACWEPEELGTLLAAAQRWARQVPRGDKYWLCWNINDRWCRLQQRLVLENGWIPIVGADCTVQKPTVVDGALFIDFNNGLDMPQIWPHFVMEFIFAWVDRLAFWHADILMPRAKLRDYARRFEAMKGPLTAAVFCRRNNFFRPRCWDNAVRWWELIGCTTREASQSQFDCGGGWWRHFQNHPNCAPVRHLDHYHWDSGGGIRYWQKEHGGQVIRTRLDSQYHFSATNRTGFPRGVYKGNALDMLDLSEIARRFGIADLLDC
jgi:hypothetical protein